MSRPTTPLPSTGNPKDPILTTPGRSSTHPVKPRYHVPHHSHRVHHHHHDKSVPQSAIQPTTSHPFGDFLAKTAGSGFHDGTKTPPRRDEAAAAAALREEKERKQREQAQWKEVEKLRVKRRAMDEDLRTTLTSLSTLSTQTTRRLDYTYYSLLSSLSALHATIADLHKLSLSTSTLSSHFSSSSTALTTEIKSQVEGAGKGFEQQARRIEDLESRMKRGREKVGSLGQRLEGVRRKVEGEGERDWEGRRRAGKRWRMCRWGLGAWVVVVLGVVVVRHWPGRSELGHEKLVEGWKSMESETAKRTRNEMGHWGGIEEIKSTPVTVSDHPVLQLLDEL